MKKGIIVIALGIIAGISGIQSCTSSKEVSVNQTEDKAVVSEVDSLEQARNNRIDSVSQIQKNPNAPANKLTNPPKTVTRKNALE